MNLVSAKLGTFEIKKFLECLKDDENRDLGTTDFLNRYIVNV